MEHVILNNGIKMPIIGLEFFKYQIKKIAKELY